MSRSLRARIERLAKALEPKSEPRIVLELVPIEYDAEGRPIDVFEIVYTEDDDDEGER